MRNNISKRRNYLVLGLVMYLSGINVMAQRHMENLDRGVIAMRIGNDSVYIGWRMLGD